MHIMQLLYNRNIRLMHWKDIEVIAMDFRMSTKHFIWHILFSFVTILKSGYCFKIWEMEVRTKWPSESNTAWHVMGWKSDSAACDLQSQTKAAPNSEGHTATESGPHRSFSCAVSSCSTCCHLCENSLLSSLSHCSSPITKKNDLFCRRGLGNFMTCIQPKNLGKHWGHESTLILAQRHFFFTNIYVGCMSPLLPPNGIHSFIFFP